MHTAQQDPHDAFACPSSDAMVMIGSTEQHEWMNRQIDNVRRRRRRSRSLRVTAAAVIVSSSVHGSCSHGDGYKKEDERIDALVDDVMNDDERWINKCCLSKRSGGFFQVRRFDEMPDSIFSVGFQIPIVYSNGSIALYHFDLPKTLS